MKTACVHFDGCNFNCLGCIRKKDCYDIHLRNKDEPKNKTQRLSLARVLKILTTLKAEKVILMGGEPTIDLEILKLTEILRALGIYTYLLTNGYILSDELIQSINEICISIKACSNDLHKKFTGKSNIRVLKNFECAYNSKALLRAESILIPDMIDAEEIEKIAKFISSIDANIPYHIDAYLPVNDLWRAPTIDEMKNAVDRARKCLKNVTCFYGNEKLSYKVINVI
ncbi:MAG: radical SAM protein [Candidatus Thermoplasmatota archaeon]|nr:radical SAM protein [Candidatus Thermoplasmatota archaeon]